MSSVYARVYNNIRVLHAHTYTKVIQPPELHKKANKKKKIY